MSGLSLSHPYALWLLLALPAAMALFRFSAKRRQADSLETAYSESEGRDVADTRATPEAELMAPLYSEPVQKALDGLPEEFRTAVLLADVEGYDYAEIAAILKIPIGTVRSRISRGRERLRATLS